MKRSLLAASLFLTACQAPPQPPSDFKAAPVPGAGILLSWTEPNSTPYYDSVTITDADHATTLDTRRYYLLESRTPGKHEITLRARGNMQSFPELKAGADYQVSKIFRPVQSADIELPTDSPLKFVPVLFTFLSAPPTASANFDLVQDLGNASFDPGELFEGIACNVLRASFVSAFEIERDEYSSVERVRRGLAGDGNNVPRLLQAKALLTVAFRPPRQDSALPPQLAVALYDLNATDYGARKPFTGRALIYEGFAELENLATYSALPEALVLAWKQLMSEMCLSPRVRAFADWIAPRQPLRSPGLSNAVLLGDTPAVTGESPSDHVRGVEAILFAAPEPPREDAQKPEQPDSPAPKQGADSEPNANEPSEKPPASEPTQKPTDPAQGEGGHEDGAG